MQFIFYYKNNEEKRELEKVLEIQCKNHFGLFNVVLPYEKSDETGHKREQLAWCVEVPVNLFMEDLQKSKENVYKQNKANDWHYLTENPEDLPDVHWSRWVIAKYDNGILFGRARRDEFADGRIRWIDSLAHTIHDVVAWKEVESNEVLLNDFLSDVEENLSFVSDREIKESSSAYTC